MGTIKVEAIEEKWQEGLREPWQQLQEASHESFVFQTWEWCTTWWRHFGEGLKPLVLAVRNENDLIGIAPLYVIKRPWGACVRWIGTGISDRLGFLAFPGAEEKVAQAVLDFLEQEQSADLQELPDHSPIVQMAESHHWLKLSQGRSSYIHLPQSWEAYAGTSCEKIPVNVEHALEKIHNEVGKVTILQASSLEMESSLEALFLLHTHRWQARGLPGEFHASNVRAFHRDWVSLASRNDWIRLYLIRVNDSILAVEYAFHYHERMYGYQSGFDPTYARYRLGALLFAYAIRRAIEEHCSVFDFLRGEEPYKREWQAQTLEHARVCHARGLAARLWRAWIALRSR